MRRILRSPLGISLLISLALWLFGAGGVINHAFWNAEYKFYGEPAPKSIVLVATDEIHDGGSLDYARLLQKLRQQGVARVFFDTKIRLAMAALIIGEVGGFAVLLAGFIVGQFG